MDFIITIKHEKPRSRRKVIEKEIFQGINYECEFIGDDQMKYQINDKVVDNFKEYLTKYKDIEY